MREEYDFTNARKNPYVQKEKKQITINLNSEVVEYFKQQAESSGIPYQTLINLYLTDCVINRRELKLSWSQKKSKKSNVGWISLTLLF